MIATYHFSIGANLQSENAITEVQEQKSEILGSLLEQKLDRLLTTLDDVKPQIDRFRLIEALTSKKGRIADP